MTTPFFIHQMIERLHSQDLSEEERLRLRARISLNTGDPQALRTLLGIDPEEFNAFYADEIPVNLSTQDTIDSFLSQYARTPQSDELQYAPAIDYASSFLEEDKISDPEARQIEKADSPHQQHLSPTSKSDTSLSESLAAAMIKNHNYPKALEIIKELSLKNPQKSVYFADQMRFLRKLIYVQSRQQ